MGSFAVVPLFVDSNFMSSRSKFQSKSSDTTLQENDNNIISEVSSVEQSRGTVEQHPATPEETRTLYDSLYNNLAIEIEKVNSVNRKLRETNVDLTTELARYINQEKCFKINQEKYDKLKRCYQKSAYHCLTKKINALHLSSAKQITTLNEEIANLNNQLSKEKSNVSFLQEERKKLKNDFKTHEDELFDKQNQLENKIKELDNILVKTGQSIQTMHMLSPKPDSFYHTEQKMALGYQNTFYLKQAQQKQQSLYNGKVLLEKHDPPVVYDSKETLQLSQESQATKFVQDFHSLAKEVDESLAKHKALELEIERLLRVVENKYAKLWNDWYKKCEECKYDKISYDKAYNDMQQKIERLQAQLGDQKGKSKDTPCVSNTLDHLSRKLENENVELNDTGSNQSEIDSLQDKSHDTIYENAKLRAQLFDMVSEQKDSNKVTPLPKSMVIPKVGKSNALSKLVTSNSAPSSRKSTVMNNERVIAPGIFRINPFKAYRVDNFVPNKHVKASVRTKPITVSQPHVVTKEDVNSNRNGFSPNNVESTTRTRRPQPRNNPKNDKVPFKSKSSCLSNKLEKKEENHRSLQSSNYPNHTSSECNNIKLAIRNEKSEVICATCKQCLITANHDECVLQYVNGMKSRKKNQSANVSKSANQKKHKANVKKSKKSGSKESLASPRPSKPRTCLRWLPTGRIFDLCGKITSSSNTESESDTSVCDNASASNPQEPTNKGFPSSTSFLGRFSKLRRQNSCIYPLAVF
ncbi:hypothetical protein Tco_0093108 [Tanacetum coccineum]